MARLAVSEGTPPGAPVYTLQGEDPEESRLHYSISGEYFTVNRDTGVVILRRALDRETQDLIEVIISITGKTARSLLRDTLRDIFKYYALWKYRIRKQRRKITSEENCIRIGCALCEFRSQTCGYTCTYQKSEIII